jgi:hypothetical protein
MVEMKELVEDGVLLLTDQAPFKAASNVVVAEEQALGGLGPLATLLGE